MKQLFPRKTGILHRKNVEKIITSVKKFMIRNMHIFCLEYKNVLAVEKECMEILLKQGEKITRPDITIIARIP